MRWSFNSNEGALDPASHAASHASGAADVVTISPGQIPVASASMIVGNGSGVGAAVAMSGDIAITNAGVTTLAFPKVVAITSQSLVFSGFTDNTNTTGYIDITTQVPAGSLVLGWKAVTSVGFTGDTTATIQVGVSGTLDKYSAVTTGSVYAAGTVGCSVKAGNVFEAAAVTARVTVTGTADFTSISAGTMIVTLYVVKTA